jgi:hypothetical protein
MESLLREKRRLGVEKGRGVHFVRLSTWLPCLLKSASTTNYQTKPPGEKVPYVSKERAQNIEKESLASTNPRYGARTMQRGIRAVKVRWAYGRHSNDDNPICDFN